MEQFTLTIRQKSAAGVVVAKASVAIGGKTVTTTFVDENTLKIITPVLSIGAQSIAITNSDGESASWDATFTAN